MALLGLVLSLAFVSCDDDDSPDDFWDKLADDSVVVEEKVEGRLYNKARFHVPIARRLRLYPAVSRAVNRLYGRSRVEFVYDAKVPSLVFLDSQDVTVEKIDLAKMSEDEIFALLNLRGFADLSDEAGPSLDGDEPAREANRTIDGGEAGPPISDAAL
jgi:hypothetical protein